MILPKTEQPSRPAERGEAEAGHDGGPPGEVRASLVLIQVVRNETIPCGRRELITGEVQGGAQDEQQRTGVRKQERQ